MTAEKLFRDYYQYALGFARRWAIQNGISVKNEILIEQLQATAVIGLWLVAKKYTPERGSFLNYLKPSIIGRLRNELKEDNGRTSSIFWKRMYSLHVEIKVNSEENSELIDTIASPQVTSAAKAAFNRELRTILLHFLPKKPQYRLIMLLRFFENKKLLEIANLLGVTHQRVQQVIQTSLRLMRKRMGESRNYFDNRTET